jgi:hypothetical protein
MMSRVLLALAAVAATALLVAGLIGLANEHQPEPSADTGTRAVAAGRPIALPLPTGYTVLPALPEQQYAQVQRAELAGPGSVLVTSPGGTLVLPALPDEQLGSAASAEAEAASE